MTRIFAACLLAAAAVVAAAPPAGADPQDLLPYCSGDQTPMNNNCRQMAGQGDTRGSGMSPGMPNGLTPNNIPVVG